jgi:hypothetical protein
MAPKLSIICNFFFIRQGIKLTIIVGLITNPLISPLLFLLLSKRGSLGVTPKSDSQPLDVPPDQRLSCHVANYKAWYKLLVQLLSWRLSHKLSEEKKKKKKKKTTKQNLPKNQAHKIPISLLVNFQSPLQGSSCYGRTRRRWWERRLRE